jgi:hypothetical protein
MTFTNICTPKTQRGMLLKRSEKTEGWLQNNVVAFNIMNTISNIR